MPRVGGLSTTLVSLKPFANSMSLILSYSMSPTIAEPVLSRLR